jgi:segregation and condensation protein B
VGRAALETLAIVAYHQPCSRAEIEEVRGARVSKGSLDRLIELGWVGAKGRRDAPGRPLLFVTTPAFLAQFGLSGLEDLPNKADLEAAGLLDARLPADFAVPVPSRAEGAGEPDADDPDGEREFASDYGEDQETSEAGTRSS